MEKLKNDIVYMDIFAIKPEIREKLHITDEELMFTEDDMELINSSDYVNLGQLKLLLREANFTNFEIPKELGISKAMYTMVFSDTSKNKRGLRMRTVIAILNAIRRRNITEPFDKILVKGGKNEKLGGL